MASFAGIRGTGDWGTDERPKNFREGILWRNPNGTAPLFALMSKVSKKSVNDPEFAWWEESQDNVRVKIQDSSGYTSTSTDLTIDVSTSTTQGGLHLVAGDLLLVEYVTEQATFDNEVLEVSSITSDTAIVVKRGVAGTTALGLADNTNLTRIGSSHAEGSTLPAISQRNPTKILNYTQIFRTVYGSTNTTIATFARTGDAYKVDKKRKAFDHANKIEFAFMFGQSNEDTSGSQIIRTTKGLRSFITTNVKVYTTSPTEDDFLDTISPIFDYAKESMAGNERIVLCGNGFLNNLNKVARNSSSTRINFDGVLRLYGMDLNKYVLPQGTLAIKTHPLMSTHGRFKNSAFFLDFSNIALALNVSCNDGMIGTWIFFSTLGILILFHEDLSIFVSRVITHTVNFHPDFGSLSVVIF